LALAISIDIRTMDKKFCCLEKIAVIKGMDYLHVILKAKNQSSIEIIVRIDSFVIYSLFCVEDAMTWTTAESIISLYYSRTTSHRENQL
jgi:hypothetical protein